MRPQSSPQSGDSTHRHLDMVGGNVKSIVEIPQKDEGFGYTLRNVMANHLAATCKMNAMNTAALCSILENTGVFEMGDAIGKPGETQINGIRISGLER